LTISAFQDAVGNMKHSGLIGTKKRSGRAYFKNLLIGMIQWRFSLPVGAWEAVLRLNASMCGLDDV
jgi:hypothetical protein